MARDVSLPSDRVTDRGQSTVVGFVLVFGILVMLLLVLQSSAVPAWNQAVEYSHNERVQSELELLRDDVFLTASTGSTTSESISLGTQYPVRPFLFNPSDPTGRLWTTEPAAVTITNATAPGEVGDYWNGTTRRFLDQHLVYRPDYHEYENAPTTVYENTVLYNRYGDRKLPYTQETIISGRRINLVTLNGSLSRQGTRPTDVEIQPLSDPEQVTTVHSDGPLVLTVPTRLSEETWTDLLADERASRGGYVTGVTVTTGDPYDTLRLTLAANTSYDLRMARVGLGTQTSTPPAHYLTTVTRSELTVPTGASELVTFEVRDRYNNPVSGVRVNASLSGPGGLTAVQPVSDSDGHAVFRYEATGAGTATVTGTFGTPDALRRATITVEAVSKGGDGGGTTVGQGGTEFYDASSPTRTFTTEGGLWRSVSGTPRLLLSNPRFAPTEAGQHEQFKVDQRHFRLVYGIETDTETYYVAVTEPSEGLFYKPSSGAWSNLETTILTQQGGTTTAVSADLNTTALDRWRRPTSAPLDMLNVHAYSTASSAAFRDKLTEIKQTLRTGEADIFVAELHGRVDLTASPDGRQVAYPDAFVDADGTTEPQERSTIPPTTPNGDVSNFLRLQQRVGDDVARLVERNKVEGMAVGTVTYGVDQSGTSYTLDIRFAYDKGGGTRQGTNDDVTVRIVDASGTTLQTATLARKNALFATKSLTLNAQAEQYVQDTGNLYVVYQQPANGVETVLDVEYQRLRVQQ